MRLRTAAVVVSLVGTCACTDDVDEPSAAPTPLPPPLGACLDASQAMRALGAIQVEGEVEEVGLGRPSPTSQGCPFGGTLQFGASSLGDPSLLAQVSWVRLRDAANNGVVLSALAEGFAFPLTKGDHVRARLDVRYVGFNAHIASLEARAVDGSLLFWMGFGIHLSDLEPPNEVRLSTGDVEAEVEDECVGSYRIRALSVDTSGTMASVPSRTRVEVGPWVVANATVEEQVGRAVCADALSDQVRVAIWPRTARVRDSGGIGGPCYDDLPITQALGAPQYRCLPDGTLTRQCAASTPCPAISQCVEGFCRPPASAD